MRSAEAHNLKDAELVSKLITVARERGIDVDRELRK